MEIKEAIRILSDVSKYADKVYREALTLAIAAMKQQEQDSWHAIAKDGLPKKDGDYLVCYEEGYREDYSLDEIGIAPFEVDCEGFGIWVESFDKHTLGSLGSDWTEIKATAWKPLPEPYQEDKA